MEPKQPLGRVGRLLLGLAFVTGAVATASLASPSTMTLTRTSAKTVTVTVETRLFNRFRIGGFRIDGAESVVVVGNVVPPTGTGPDLPSAISLYFVTPNGAVSYGVRQKLFDGHASAIRGFFDSDAPSTTLSVNQPDSGLVRFIIVHLTITVMALIGVMVTWAGLVGLFRR